MNGLAHFPFCTEVFVTVSPAAGSLLSLLAEIPDPRGRHGRRHPLSAMLAAIVCGLLTGARGYKAIAEWTRDQSSTVWHWLGFTRKPPCANSFRNLLLVLPPETLEGILRQWMAAILEQPLPDERRGTSLDGKTLCNTLAAQERNVHLLSLLDQALGGVLSQQAVDPTTNEAKAALELLKTIVLKGRLVTGDAMFCQREICQQIIDSGGDYLFVVKDNQPELKAAIEAEFQPGFSPRYRAAAEAFAL
jgi:DDE_Tnp_1-associated/Transposase DDE domain